MSRLFDGGQRGKSESITKVSSSCVSALAEAAGTCEPEAQLTAACLQLSDGGLDGRTLVTHVCAAVQAAVAEGHRSGRQLGIRFLSRRAITGRDKGGRQD